MGYLYLIQPYGLRAEAESVPFVLMSTVRLTSTEEHTERLLLPAWNAFRIRDCDGHHTLGMGSLYLEKSIRFAARSAPFVRVSDCQDDKYGEHTE